MSTIYTVWWSKTNWSFINHRGIDPAGTNLYMTDPSGSYISYNAISIGANSDVAMNS